MPKVVSTLLFILIVAVGCGPDFTPYWKVDKLRVLGIQADSVVAKQGQPVTLSALVYAPDGSEVDYHWSWCPLRPSAEDDYRCPVDADDFRDFAPENNSQGGDSEDSNGDDSMPDDIFELGDDSQATFVTPFDEEQVRQFCEALQQQFTEEVDDPEMAELLPGGDCEKGYEITARLEVTSGDESIVAAKRFTLWGGDEDHNENPVVDTLELRPADSDDLSILIEQAGWDVDADADRDDQWITVDADDGLRAIEDVPLEMRALIDPDSVQTYTPSGADEAREESFVYRHFTTAGTFNSTRRIYSPDDNTLATASNVVHNISGSQLEDECQTRSDEGCLLRLWTVVRDSRLGTDWIERAVLVQPKEAR